MFKMKYTYSNCYRNQIKLHGIGKYVVFSTNYNHHTPAVDKRLYHISDLLLAPEPISCDMFTKAATNMRDRLLSLAQRSSSENNYLKRKTQP